MPPPPAAKNPSPDALAISPPAAVPPSSVGGPSSAPLALADAGNGTETGDGLVLDADADGTPPTLAKLFSFNFNTDEDDLFDNETEARLKPKEFWYRSCRPVFAFRRSKRLKRRMDWARMCVKRLKDKKETKTEASIYIMLCLAK